MLENRIITILCILFLGGGILIAQPEICDNGIDDDNDNLIDLNDPDCVCLEATPISMIPNPSFEEMNCCPADRSELNCATDWIQASDPTTDYIHTCGWLGWSDFPPPQPFPDGEGIMGFRDGTLRSTGDYEPRWKEYAGACLLRPLLKDVTYLFEFDLGFVNPQYSPPINISFFGTSDCDNLPFGQLGCPSLYPAWDKLSDVFIGGGSTNIWIKSALQITPEEDIYAIAIGPDCPLNSSMEDAYYFFDNLLLAEIDSFGLVVQEVSHPCKSDFAMAVEENPDFEYQWYKSGVALVGETTSELSSVYGPGIYQVRILDGNSCLISENYEYRIPSFSSTSQVSICGDETYEFGPSILSSPGFYVETFANQNNCDSIVSLELEVIENQSSRLEAAILLGDTYEISNNQFTEPGEYPITFVSSLGCDSLVMLNLSTFEVFIPTAFSPNFDGLNDYFQPFSASGKIVSIEMKIFDRWGGLLFEGDRWDGSEFNPGVFVYVMRIAFDYGAIKEYAGSVTLLR